MMKRMMANKAMTGDKEQISTMLRQLGQSIEGNAIYSHEDWSREMRTFIKLNPVGVVIVRHGILNSFYAPCSSFIPLAQSQKNC
jgi:hypothetical protein